MKHIFTVFILLAMGAVQAQVVSLNNGDKAPLMERNMKNVNGLETSIAAEQKSNGTIVIFSCNTCPFVVGSDDFGGWEQVYPSIKKWADSLGFGMILVNSNEAKRSNEDSFDAMKMRAREKAYTFPYVVDEKSELANAFGAKTTPHVFVISKDGLVVYQGAIDNSVDPKRSKEENYLIDALQAISNQQPIAVPTTVPRGCSIKRK